MIKKFLGAISMVSQFTQALKPINEKVRFSGGDSGIAISLSADGLNFLKQQGLPYLYSAIADIQVPDQSFTKGWLELNIKNINV